MRLLRIFSAVVYITGSFSENLELRNRQWIFSDPIFLQVQGMLRQLTLSRANKSRLFVAAHQELAGRTRSKSQVDARSQAEQDFGFHCIDLGFLPASTGRGRLFANHFCQLNTDSQRLSATADG